MMSLRMLYLMAVAHFGPKFLANVHFGITNSSTNKQPCFWSEMQFSSAKFGSLSRDIK